MTNIPIIVAFVAGILSFLSPCVLPIIPGFLAYMGGASGGEAPSRKSVFLASVFFVLGFSIVFALLGVLLNGVLSAVAASVQMWLARLGGAIVIFFGLYLMKLFRVPFLEYNHGMRMGALPKSKMLTSLLLGFAFAVGWTPCVGAVLGGIIGLAAAAPGKAFVLLISYAIGLGVPFLIVGAFAGEATRFLNRSAVIASYITPIFGFLLVILGILVFTESLSLVANFGFLNKLLLL